MPLSAKTARERQLKNEILLQSYVLFSCRRHRFCRRRRRRSQLERGWSLSTQIDICLTILCHRRKLWQRKIKTEDVSFYMYTFWAEYKVKHFARLLKWNFVASLAKIAKKKESTRRRWKKSGRKIIFTVPYIWRDAESHTENRVPAKSNYTVKRCVCIEIGIDLLPSAWKSRFALTHTLCCRYRRRCYKR